MNFGLNGNEDWLKVASKVTRAFKAGKKAYKAPKTVKASVPLEPVFTDPVTSTLKHPLAIPAIIAVGLGVYLFVTKK